MPQDYRTYDTTNDEYFSTHSKIDKRHFYYRVQFEGRCVRYLKDEFVDIGNFVGNIYISSSNGASDFAISGYSTEPDIAWLQHVIETEYPTIEMHILENGKELFES